MEVTESYFEEAAQGQVHGDDVEGQSRAREVLLANARRRFLRAGAVAVPTIITLRATPVLAGGTCAASGAS